MTIRHILLTLATALTLFGISSCSDSTTEPVETGVSAKVNGAAWTGAAVSFTHGDSSISFTASTVNTNPLEHISVSLNHIKGTGSYIVGGKDGAICEWGSDLDSYSTIDTLNTVQGEVKLTTFDSKQASGTFSFTAHRNMDENDDIVVVGEGKFTLVFN